MRRLRSLVFPLCLLTTLLAPVPLLAQAPDTTNHGPPFFTYRDAVLLGIFGVGALAMHPLDRNFASHLQEPAYQNSSFLHNTSTFFRLMGQPAPQIIGLGLYGVGRLTHNQKITKLAVHGSEAMILSTTATTLIKVMAGRARPRVDTTQALGFHFMRGLPSFLGGKGAEYQSFPSGHATTAFAVASAATAEYAHWADSWH
ncbi:MAG TPA: phosphatase PAP2 family protein, partial [Longimicrobiales bacterium]